LQFLFGDMQEAGIILTASHNPIQLNALKLLNSRGNLSLMRRGKSILEKSFGKKILFSQEVKKLGKYSQIDDYMDPPHFSIGSDLELVDARAIQSRNFKIVVRPL